jgi:predicted N-formylglutamate amidohydrolase
VPPLIAPDEPHPVAVERPDAGGELLLLADHGGNLVPRRLAGLGLAQADLDRHIGIDIGVLGVSRGLSRLLDATLVHQRYSRLVIDCNRPPGGPDAIPACSDGTRVPGNEGLTERARCERVEAIFKPYHAAIDALLDARGLAGRAPVVVAMHSFTPVHGELPGPRPWHIGVLWNRDSRLACALLAELTTEPGLTLGNNQPYGVSDDIDYAIPVHCEARGLLHVEIEIRQDLILDAPGQQAWAERLARALPRALGRARGVPLAVAGAPS